MKKFVLASSSPRRQEILRGIGIDFDVMPSRYEEIIIDISPYELVQRFAYEKANEVAKRIEGEKIVIAADTIVYANGNILGKPRDKEDATRMLKSLSNSIHSVITGVCVLDTSNGNCYNDYEETNVFFKELREEEIECYIESGEPMDKAGAYGIQGIGGLFVTKIQGCFFNVVGLPVYKLNYLLGKMGVNLLIKEV